MYTEVTTAEAQCSRIKLAVAWRIIVGEDEEVVSG